MVWSSPMPIWISEKSFPKHKNSSLLPTLRCSSSHKVKPKSSTDNMKINPSFLPLSTSWLPIMLLAWNLSHKMPLKNGGISLDLQTHLKPSNRHQSQSEPNMARMEPKMPYMAVTLHNPLNGNLDWFSVLARTLKYLYISNLVQTIWIKLHSLHHKTAYRKKETSRKDHWRHFNSGFWDQCNADDMVRCLSCTVILLGLQLLARVSQISRPIGIRTCDCIGSKTVECCWTVATVVWAVRPWNRQKTRT
jgi:hypothetical protein